MILKPRPTAPAAIDARSAAAALPGQQTSQAANYRPADGPSTDKELNNLENVGQGQGHTPTPGAL